MNISNRRHLVLQRFGSLPEFATQTKRPQILRYIDTLAVIIYGIPSMADGSPISGTRQRLESLWVFISCLPFVIVMDGVDNVARDIERIIPIKPFESTKDAAEWIRLQLQPTLVKYSRERIASWETMELGEMSEIYADPEYHVSRSKQLWGPIIWNFIHHTAHSIDAIPLSGRRCVCQLMWVKMMSLLPMLMACEACCKHCSDKQSDSLVTIDSHWRHNPPIDCHASKPLSAWAFRFHQQVNTDTTNLSNTNFSYEDAIRIYEHNPII
jgi:hypothetical protein